MDEFTTEELAEWVHDRFSYELKPGEITAAEYARLKDVEHNTAGGRLNKLVRDGFMHSKREIIDGKNVRVFWRVPSVEYETTD